LRDYFNKIPASAGARRFSLLLVAVALLFSVLHPQSREPDYLAMDGFPAVSFASRHSLDAILSWRHRWSFGMRQMFKPRKKRNSSEYDLKSARQILSDRKRHQRYPNLIAWAEGIVASNYGTAHPRQERRQLALFQEVNDAQ
jgi:hypothetical protein